MNTTGVEETYFKTFILTEDGLRGFHKTLENAARYFPAPAEVIYTIVTSNYRYFETTRLEEVLHDLEVQDRHIIQLIADADFVQQPDRVVDGIVHKGTRENWNVRVTFTMGYRGLWDTRHDRISLRVQSEDRQWAADIIDRLEDQIYSLPAGNRSPNLIFWLFGLPLFVLVKGYLAHIGDLKAWLATPFEQYSFYAYAVLSALTVMIGTANRFFNFNPFAFRRLFGPESSFAWGQGKFDFEVRERLRHLTLILLGIAFLFFLFVSLKFSIQ